MLEAPITIPTAEVSASGVEVAVHAAVTTSLPTEAERRAAWLEDRRSCITGTDVAAILGLSKWASPLTVYLDKKGLRTVEENEAMRWGRRLERTILEAYADHTGEPLEFADSYTLHRVPGFPLLGASLDARRVHSDRRPVDAKNTRVKGTDWGEAGTDAFPIWYQTQGVVQMAATDTPAFDLAVLFSGQEFATYTLHRDLETEAIVKEKVESWWKKHIIGDVPPEADGSDACSEYLKTRFAKAAEVTVDPTPEFLAWVKARQEAAAALADAEAAKKDAENKIKQFLGEASAVPGVLTYKNNKASTSVNYEGAFLDLLSAIERDRNQNVRALAQTLVAKFTETKPGVRVLRFSK